MIDKANLTTGPARLRALLTRDAPVVAPLALDPISARWAEAAGFEVLYLGGGTMGYAATATEAHLSLTKMVHVGIDIRAACSLPIILDGTCGWGDPMHMHHTIAMAEAAGFAAIEIEDQLLPRRVHHHIGTEHLIPIELMVQKIEEAVAARRDPDFVIIARTNALRSTTVDEAVRRAEAYREAGADVLYVLQQNPEQARAVAQRIEGPLLYAMLEGLDSIGLSTAELSQLGYKILVDGGTPFFAAQKALRLSYEALASGLVDPTIGNSYAEETSLIHDVIGLPKLLEIERRTVEV